MEIMTREIDGWWNLTTLSRDHGKAIADFLRLRSTKDFMAILERDLGYPPVEVNVGGTSPGTWGHPIVGAKCLSWISPSHEVAVYKEADSPKKLYVVLARVEDWVETGDNSYAVRIKNVFCGVWDTELAAQEFIRDYGDDVWMADDLSVREIAINTYDPACMECLSD